MPVKDRPEAKTFALKLDAPPDDEGKFSGHAAVFGNVDLQGDIIDAGATAKSLKENPQVPILYQHDYMEPIGISIEMLEDSKGLAVEGQLALDVQRGSETHALMKMGAIKGLSIGYRPIKSVFDKVSGKTVRRLKEIAILEWSPVVFPANPLAGIDTVKAQKWLGQYSATESVDCLLSMIASGTDYLAAEVDEGDASDAEAMQGVLGQLAELLASEIADVAAGDTGDEDPDVIVWVEELRSPIQQSIKKLQALLDSEPAKATRELERAAAQQAEPAEAALRALQEAMRSPSASAA